MSRRRSEGDPPRAIAGRLRFVLLRDRSDRIAERLLRLLLGLALFGVSLALLVDAGLGLDPWDVLAQGVARRTGLQIGTVVVLISLALLVLFIPLRQRPGVGTRANAVVVGLVLDLVLPLLPRPDTLWEQSGLLIAAILGCGCATGLYIGAGWGAGPRDGLMTGLAARGVPLLLARAAIELTALVVGWLLGGSVGIGTALYALGIGPLVAWLLPRLTVRDAPDEPTE